MTGFAKRYSKESSVRQRWTISKGQSQHLQKRARQAGLPATYLAIRPGFAVHTRFKTCQWIAGNPSPTDSCKCGDPTIDGRPYCARHAAIAYVTSDE